MIRTPHPSKTGKPTLESKTAANIYGTVTKLFDDAVNSKTLALRVREDDPTSAVRGPDRLPGKSLAFLYPAEFLSVATCAKVDHAWRRTITIALYLGLRPGELEALEWPDVDLARGLVQVHRATKRDSGRTGRTKTGNVRTIRAPTTLLPLLAAMQGEAEGKGRVIRHLPDDSRCAKLLRASLRAAGCNRSELFADDASRKHARFRDLRATYATWQAIQGEQPFAIMESLGHTRIETTQRYVRRVQHLRDVFGAVFPALPRDLIARPESSPETSPARANADLDDSNDVDPPAEIPEKATGTDGTTRAPMSSIPMRFR